MIWSSVADGEKADIGPSPRGHPDVVVIRYSATAGEFTNQPPTGLGFSLSTEVIRVDAARFTSPELPGVESGVLLWARGGGVSVFLSRSDASRIVDAIDRIEKIHEGKPPLRHFRASFATQSGFSIGCSDNPDFGLDPQNAGCCGCWIYLNSETRMETTPGSLRQFRELLIQAQQLLK
ncbi:MAG TPA: hypothetical protein VMV72_05130 [Verrucomicrobiae bacterium]|nr:hypothetical protein [Verrucomicrobiae bacterium]